MPSPNFHVTSPESGPWSVPLPGTHYLVPYWALVCPITWYPLPGVLLGPGLSYPLPGALLGPGLFHYLVPITWCPMALVCPITWCPIGPWLSHWDPAWPISSTPTPTWSTRPACRPLNSQDFTVRQGSFAISLQIYIWVKISCHLATCMIML